RWGLDLISAKSLPADTPCAAPSTSQLEQGRDDSTIGSFAGAPRVWFRGAPAPFTAGRCCAQARKRRPPPRVPRHVGGPVAIGEGSPYRPHHAAILTEVLNPECI